MKKSRLAALKLNHLPWFCGRFGAICFFCICIHYLNGTAFWCFISKSPHLALPMQVTIWLGARLDIPQTDFGFSWDLKLCWLWDQQKAKPQPPHGMLGASRLCGHSGPLWLCSRGWFGFSKARGCLGTAEYSHLTREHIFSYFLLACSPSSCTHTLAPESPDTGLLLPPPWPQLREQLQ